MELAQPQSIYAPDRISQFVGNCDHFYRSGNWLVVVDHVSGRESTYNLSSTTRITRHYGSMAIVIAVAITFIGLMIGAGCLMVFRQPVEIFTTLNIIEGVILVAALGLILKYCIQGLFWAFTYVYRGSGTMKLRFGDGQRPLSLSINYWPNSDEARHIHQQLIAD